MVQCTNRQKQSKTVKNSQKQSKDTQNSKNYHWCTNRHMSTKTVSTVYQQCTNGQKQLKTVKRQSNSKNDHWCIVTCLHRILRIHKVRVRRIHKAAGHESDSYKRRYNKCPDLYLYFYLGGGLNCVIRLTGGQGQSPADDLGNKSRRRLCLVDDKNR